jgi:hypothetical protein
MKSWARVFPFSLAVAFPLVAAAQAIPDPTQALLNALTNARSSGAAQDAKVAALVPADRDALAYWLGGHGRAALHARGASDEEIGVPFYPADYLIVAAPFPASVVPLVDPTPGPPTAPTPAPTRPPRHANFSLLGGLLPVLNIPIGSSSSSSSSTTTTTTGNVTTINRTTQSSGSSIGISGNPWSMVGALIDARAGSNDITQTSPPAWRLLPFAASAMSSSGAHVDVNSGFAAVKRDGTEGLACVSFTNQGKKTATEVDIDIEILGEAGFIRRVQPLRRVGTFARGVEIGGPTTPQDATTARQNCVVDGENSVADPTDPFSNATAVVYAVRQVYYTDGSTWLQPGANTWRT